MKRILAITGIRSDYDLMSSLYRKLSGGALGVDFKLLVGGSHMSRSYGYTVENIEHDGIPILHKVESLIDSDSLSSRLKTGAIMLQNVIDVVANWSPHLIIYAGDREEVWIGALLGAYLEIPSIHFYAGDHTRVAQVDNPVRHAASKLATAHFVQTEEHKRRLLAMGEDERRLFVVGNLSLDNFVDTPLLSLDVVTERLGRAPPENPYAMVLFHPDPVERSVAGRYMTNILESLAEAGVGACVGYPNTDPSNRQIIDAMSNFEGAERVLLYRSLDRDLFLSLYKRADFIIGNSSSGLLEAASIPIPAVNVGLRQRGRMAPRNVVFCDANKPAIAAAVAAVRSTDFRAGLKGMTNPYGDGHSADRSLDILLNTDFSQMIWKVEDALDFSCKSVKS